MAALPSVNLEPIQEMNEQQQLEMALRISRQQAMGNNGLNLADERPLYGEVGNDLDSDSDEYYDGGYPAYRHVMSEEERIRRENERLAKLHIGLEELDGDSPQATKPKLITGSLSSHQLAALYDMKRREKDGIEFKIGVNHAKLYQNVGILGDKPGHGKTRIALSLIASDYNKKGKIEFRREKFFVSKNIGSVGSLIITEPLYEEKEKSKKSSKKRDTDSNNRKGKARKSLDKDEDTSNVSDDENNEEESSPRSVNSEEEESSHEEGSSRWGYNEEKGRYTHKKRLDMTLVILPSKLVNLWIGEIEKQTQFKYHLMKPRTSPNFDQLQKNGVHIVIGNIATWRISLGYRWRRIIIDEADTIRTVGDELDYEFLWFITGSYDDLIKRTTQLPGKTLREIRKEREYYNHLVTKNSDEFIEESKLTPPYDEYTVTCKGVRAIRHVKKLMGRDVAEMVSSGDIKGAILALGGKEGENENLLDLVTNKLKIKLENLQTTRKYIETLRYDNEQQRKERLDRNDIEIKAVETQIKQANSAIEEIKNDDFVCTICYEPVDKVTILPCTHGYCGPCIISWFNERHNNTCPTCRAVINLKDLVVIDREDLKDCNDCTETKMCKKCKTKLKEKKKNEKNKKKEKDEKKKVRTKADALQEICKAMTRVLIFTKNQGGFEKLKVTLKDCGKKVDEYINNRTTVLQAFRDGKIDVLILDPATTAGIPLKEANVVVIYHTLPEGLDRQAIGRAQRPGRTQPLVVFRLEYEYDDETDM